MRWIFGLEGACVDAVDAVDEHECTMVWYCTNVGV